MKREAAKDQPIPPRDHAGVEAHSQGFFVDPSIPSVPDISYEAGSACTPHDSTGNKPKKKLKALDVIGLLAFACAFLILVMLRFYVVPTGSMLPTIQEGDRVFTVVNYFPNGHSYVPGDVVCFNAPDGSVYIKRVIASGGQHVEIYGDEVLVDGEPTKWTGNSTSDGKSWDIDIVLADDEYWVMGDNRANSQDSRYIGPVSASKMISHAIGTYFPFSIF